MLYYRTELCKSINTDETAAMGAVYQTAYLGKGFNYYCCIIGQNLVRL